MSFVYDYNEHDNSECNAYANDDDDDDDENITGGPPVR
jgi:hypothetical protein